MAKLTSPYNFVPLNRRVYVPSWYKDVSQDIPFEDGEDGWIEVTWKNVSPLIIKEKADKGDSGNKESVPVHVEEADGKRRYFIPGTSMKGMLRSTLEILSFGKMEQYNDRFFGHREFDTRLTEGREYQREMQNVRWGWLRKDDDDNLFLSPCDKDVEKILVLELEHEYPGLDTKTSQWERNDYIAGKSGQGMFPKRGSYRLYCTGKMRGKKHEYLIPIATEKEEKLPDETKKAFLTVHAPTPDFGKFEDLLDKGGMIPVSYIRKSGKVVAVGLSRMLRNPYKQNVRTLVGKEQESVEGKDLCETIFGFIGKTSKDESLRGRVQVGHAFCVDAPDGNELLGEKIGVLGEPKPSFYPLYLKQAGPEYKTFNDAEGIAGRKLYRVHTGAGVLPLPQGNDNDNTKSSMRPLRTGLAFVMRINLHNMRPLEIGAILSALTLHDTKGAWHNVGSGKSFGYGKLECVDVKLERLKHDKACYMRAFEEEMEIFARIELQIKWSKTNQIKMLVGILSEHNDDDVRMMELKEYGEASKNIYFQQLKKAVKEADREIISLLTPDFEEKLKDEVFRRKNKDLYVKAETLERDGKLKEAKDTYVDIIGLRRQIGLDTDEEEKHVEEIMAEIRKRFLEELKDGSEKAKKLEEEGKLTDAISIYNELILKLQSKGLSTDELEKIIGELRGRITELRRAKRLKDVLEEKYDDGRFKRDTVKKALDIAEDWLRKTTHKLELSEEEKQDLYSTLKRLKSCPGKEDKKLWGNPKDKTWKRIERMIGEELTNKLRL